MKKIITTLSFSIVLISVSSCGTTSSTNDCIDESKISIGPCTLEYAPVCGCDKKTYSNACAAERSGVRSWIQGECSNL